MTEEREQIGWKVTVEKVFKDPDRYSNWTVEVYSQTVNDLDIQAVINAVNPVYPQSGLIYIDVHPTHVMGREKEDGSDSCNKCGRDGSLLSRACSS